MSSPPRLNVSFWLLARDQYIEHADPLEVARDWLVCVDAFQSQSPDDGITTMRRRLETHRLYKAPEHTRRAQSDEPALVYSLALLLFERLTGHHPFVDSSATKTEDRFDGPPIGLREILSWALNPFPEDRYPRVEGLRRSVECWIMRELDARLLGQPSALAQYQYHSQVASSPPGDFVDTVEDAVVVIPHGRERSATERLLNFYKRNPASHLATGVGAALGIVLCLLFVALFSAESPSQASDSQAKAATAEPPPTPRAQKLVQAEAPQPSTLPEPAARAPKLGHSLEDLLPQILRDCTPSQSYAQGVSMGLSIDYAPSGQVDRIFFQRRFAASIRACVRGALKPLVSADSEAAGRRIRYRLWISPDEEVLTVL
jgi:hypothetical protein